MNAGLTDPLDAARIRAALSRDVCEHVKVLDVVESLDSTNAVLAARSAPPLGYSEVLLAEFQTAGRGRRGRSWLAAPGGAICLSFSWTFRRMPRDAGALSLAIGVCALRALKSQRVADVQLKWPNDILVGGRKLGGILIELRAEPSGSVCAVVGIGLNVALGAALLEEISAMGLPATDLISTGAAPSRNAIAARLIEGCLRGFMQFEREGLRPFIEEWQQADALRGRTVTVQVAEESTQGFARGVDASGALLVETPQGIKKFISGDVTVRSVA